MGTSINFKWQNDAACKDMSLVSYEPFYPNRGRSAEKDTGNICNSCPVKDQCLDHALKYEKYGYWGGTNARQRIKMRKDLGIELIDIDHEFLVKYAEEKARIEDAIQANKMKRGPKKGSKRKKEECESDLLSQF